MYLVWVVIKIGKGIENFFLCVDVVNEFLLVYYFLYFCFVNDGMIFVIYLVVCLIKWLMWLVGFWLCVYDEI